MPKKARERRRRGDGNVTVAKRDAKGNPILWKASISLGVVTIDGKKRRNRPTVYATSEPEAHRLLKQLQARHLTGDDMTSNKQTVEAFLLRWLEHVKTVRSAGTYAVYEAKCRVHIIPAIGGIKLRSLKTPHIQAMLDALTNKRLARNTIHSIRSVIVRALNTARKWGEIKYNIATDTEVQPVIEKKPLVLTEAQLDKLIKTVAGDPIEPLILIALGTGLRISECLGLLWANVDYEANELHITGAIKRHRSDQDKRGERYILVRESYDKTRSQRTTHMAADVADAFRMQWDRQQKKREAAGPAWKERAFVFTDNNGQPLDPTRTTQRFKDLAIRAGLPPEFHFHSLRHSCAAFLIKQGVHQRTIMEILGHRNLRTAERYGQVLPDVTRDALDKHAARLNRRRSVK
jgi:integrase